MDGLIHYLKETAKYLEQWLLREVMLTQPLLMTDRKNLHALCEGYWSEDIFNMDETWLFFRETTNKSFYTKGEDSAGGKQSKERIGLVSTASMMGEKLKPLVIGKAQKPKCFAFNVCFIFKQLKNENNGMQSMHPYENSINTQPRPPPPPE